VLLLCPRRTARPTASGCPSPRRGLPGRTQPASPRLHADEKMGRRRTTTDEVGRLSRRRGLEPVGRQPASAARCCADVLEHREEALARDPARGRRTPQVAGPKKRSGPRRTTGPAGPHPGRGRRPPRTLVSPGPPPGSRARPTYPGFPARGPRLVRAPELPLPACARCCSDVRLREGTGRRRDRPPDSRWTNAGDRARPRPELGRPRPDRRSTLR